MLTQWLNSRKIKKNKILNKDISVELEHLFSELDLQLNLKHAKSEELQKIQEHISQYLTN